MEAPPIAMKAGKGPVPDEGYVICAVNEIEVIPFPALMVSALEAKDAVSVEGAGGLIPSSYCWMSVLSCCCLHAHSARLVTLAPSTKTKGFGSLVTVGGT